MGRFHALQERGKATQTQLIGTKQWQYYEFSPEVVPELVCLPRTAGAIEVYYRSSHLKPDSQNQSSTLKPKTVQHNVVKYMVANANSHAFGYVPQVVREQRKKENCLPIRNQGQIDEGEQKKRSNQIESARGKVRVLLVGNYSIKMEKYKMAASAILTPKVGYSFADELKRAWFWVRKVLDKPQDVDEATLRCLKMVFVGDMSDGALKRIANAFFSWSDLLMGKYGEKALDWDGVSEDADINDNSCPAMQIVFRREITIYAWWELESSNAEATS
ncbi:hypothetical protein CUMW_273820 [Citrus unshiu]|uniref:Uncharacterized protein n=1 Tax=Citrus unshiu TaxID=55188 RepID=A0A2H5MX04_CITUN|nr:hypothetical protein CUMW_273820 [Citrus unshiu]